MLMKEECDYMSVLLFSLLPTEGAVYTYIYRGL